MRRVFVNGTFDVIHWAHLELLNWAKSQGDYLMVALDSDRRITEKKGPDRPVNREVNRVALMLNLKPVNEVKIFDTDQELIDIIKAYGPDTMVVGSDWRGKPVIGGEHAKRLVFFDRIGDESTTKTLENFINRRQLHR